MNWLGDNVNQLALLGAAAIILLTVFVVAKYVRQMKNDTSTGELADENWDGIGEYKNPLPMGWALSFLGTIVWALWYWLAGYPLWAYSQIGEYNEEVQSYNKNFEAKWANPDHATLMGMGEGVFLVQCAPCHGIDGAGINGKAANFEEWGNAAGVLSVIKNGSKGLGYPLGEMPGMDGLFNANTGAPITEADAKTVSAYVANGMSGAGAEIYTGVCAACHGPDGKGMGGSTPDLTTYGKPAFVKDVLNRGKAGTIGMMPKFNDGRLTEVQKEAVATYILSIGQ